MARTKIVEASPAKKKQSVADRVAAMYSKNAHVKQAFKGRFEKRAYTENDGVPLRQGHPIRELSGLPCIPFNKIVQSAGKPDTGKSTTAALTIADAQAAGFKIVPWDTEEKMDAARLQKLGGDSDAMEDPIRTNEIVIGGQLVKDYIDVIKTDDPKAKILVVIDSIGGGVSRANAEINRLKKRNAQPAQEAKEWAQVTRDIVAMINKYPDSICVYMANQTYAKIGFMQKGDKAKGGDGIEFHSSLIIFWKQLKKLTKLVDKKMVKLGIITQATVTKNHLSQDETSIYQMNFEINASGMKVSDFSFKKAEDENEEDDED